MFRTLRAQVFIVLFSVSLFALFFALLLRQEIVLGFREHIEREKGEGVSRMKAVFEASYERYQDWQHEMLVRDVLWSMMLGYEVGLFDASGRKLMDTEGALNSLLPSAREALKTLSGLATAGNRAGFSGHRLFHAGKEIGRLDVRSLERPEEEHIFVTEVDGFLLIYLCAMGGIAVVLSVFFSRKVTKPIENLSAAAEAIRDGNLESRVTINGNDEVSRLSETFNRMAQNLETQETLRKKLVSNVAHELRTPITAIQGEIEGMIDGFIPAKREHLQSLHEEVGRLKNILEGIDDLSQAEASTLTLKKRALDLRQFLQNIIEELGKLFQEKGIEIRLECPDGLLITADPDRLSQMIINLLSNALKATEKGGRVLISASKRGPEVAIEVADTGCGIRHEDLPFIFERFYRVWRDGLGLGLSIVKELADAHGGRIEAKS